jgi:hypothetical protein
VSTAEADALVAAPAWRAHIADPKPAFCAGCLRGADAEAVFVDLGMPVERGYIRELGSQAVIAELNRLCLCDACVREMAEALAFEPGLHRRHLAKLREVMAERDQLKDENVKLRTLVAHGLLGKTDESRGE